MIDKTIDEINKMKVEELKTLLKAEGLSTAGKKADLVARILATLEASPAAQQEGDSSKNKLGEGGSYWESSQPDEPLHAEIANDVTSQHHDDSPTDEVSTTDAKTSEDKSERDHLNNANIANSSEIGFDNDKQRDDKAVQEVVQNPVEIMQTEEDLVDYSDVVEEPILEATSDHNNDLSVTASDQVVAEPTVDHDESSNVINTESEKVSEKKLREERELKLRLLALKNKKSKASAAQSSSSVFTPTNVPTNHVRIDYLQRPLTLKALRQWLVETCNMEISESSIWLNSIKTHCYIDFETTEDAKKCIEAVSGNYFPETNTKTLEADYSRVCVVDAPNSEEAQRRPGEWKVPTVSVPISENENVTSNTERPSSRGTKVFDIVRKAAEVAAISSNKFRSAVTSEELQSRKHRLPEQSREHNEKRAKLSNINVEPKVNDIKDGPSLDTLFKKTKFEPHIYWTPVSDDIALKRIEAKIAKR